RHALGQRIPQRHSPFCPFVAHWPCTHIRQGSGSRSRARAALHPSPDRCGKRRPREIAMSEVAAPVKGTRPEGAVSEADASKKVREMFTQIAPHYDLLNHLLSFELDRLWRARAAKRLRPI